MPSLVPPESESPAAKPIETRRVLDAALDGKRISAAEAAHLLGLSREADVQALGEAADELRRRQCGETVTYTSRTSLFLTNFCELQPTVYPYPRKPGANHTFTLTVDGIDAAIETARGRGFKRIHISSGGYWPYLQIPGLEAPTLLKTYARLTGYVRERAPEIRIEGFSPDEIEFLAVVGDRNERYVLEMLRDQGLSALGGHGIEILEDAVRRKVSPKKAKVKRWFEIAAIAHALDLPVTAKIEGGHFETPAQRAQHLARIRDFLDRHPAALSVIIPQLWTRPLAGRENAPGAKASGRPDRLKLQAVIRLVLGEALSAQQVLWVPAANSGETFEQAQECLRWGASDMGGTDALAYQAFLAGTQEPTSFGAGELESLILDAGRQPQLI